MDGVVFGIFLVLVTVVSEIGIEKSVTHLVKGLII